MRGSGRVVVGDSRFAGKKTAVALMKENGLFFLGMVKTNTSGYPLKYLREACGTERGDQCRRRSSRTASP